MIDLAKWDLPKLTNEWRAARPFAHVVIDNLVSAESLTALCGAASAEPHWPNRGEIYDMMGSGDTVQHPTLRAFESELGSAETLAAVGALSGATLTSVELRSYVYLAGSYLLPHSDCRPQLRRRVAFAFYLWTEGVRGGELELFDVRLDQGHPVETRPAVLIEPRSNRLVLFEVTPASLHQVREVLEGARLSLAGWFHD